MRVLMTAALIVLLSACSTSVVAQERRVTAVSRAAFAKVVEALEQAITDQHLALGCQADPPKGAAARGIAIKDKGTTTVSYMPPPTVFAPYRHPGVRAVAAGLDPIFNATVDQALGGR
ncbi:MAG: hypothetical protein HY294_15180 [Candidatus Rokubacteria bacterium]|nr:hypothetical protein [Candidatus Rokubacteria bacterium]